MSCEKNKFELVNPININYTFSDHELYIEVEVIYYPDMEGLLSYAKNINGGVRSIVLYDLSQNNKIVYERNMFDVWKLREMKAGDFTVPKFTFW